MEVDYTSYISALMTLLDRIELASDDEEAVREICSQRFQTAEDHGFTIEFGEPASAEIH